MRGFPAILLDAILPALMASLVGIGVVFSIRRAWGQRAQWTERSQPGFLGISKQVAVLVGIAIWILAMIGVSYTRLCFHYDLWALRSDNVQEIVVGERCFSDRVSIDRIVADMKSSEWYSVNHGGWGDETTITVKLRSGQQWFLRAGYHFTQQGAVISKSSGPGGRGWAMGEVFSTSLPHTLDELGMPLSHCDTAHGHPCQTN